MSLETTESYEFSPIELKSFSGERHVTIDQAYKTISTDRRLEPQKLTDAISEGKIRVYTFKDEEYLDSYDLGKVFHTSNPNPTGVKVPRYFSKKGVDPLEEAGPYETRVLQLFDHNTGKEVYRMEDAQFPASWSDNDASIVSQKYFFTPNDPESKKKLEDKLGASYERSPAELFRRTTNFITDEGDKLGYFKTPEDRESFRNELLALQIQRKLAFNSPVQFNAGIYNEYGVEGNNNPRFWKNPKTGIVEEIRGGEYIHPQVHACFISGPEDDLDSILQQVINEGRIFSAGSGIGQNIGALRAEGEPLSGGGKSSGPMSFFKIYDVGAQAIKSGGKSRRAARMTTMRSSHPDNIKFIRSKLEENKKALELMKAGYPGGMDGEAVMTIAYENTNISVRLKNSDLEKAVNGGEIELKRVTDNKVIGKVSADQLLKEIAFGAWRCGDPGVQYEDMIQLMHTTPNTARQNSTNPCSEYMYIDDTSCNLASINSEAFTDEKGILDTEAYARAAWLATIALDINNNAGSYPTQSIANTSPEHRTIGLGYAGIGSTLMKMGLSYDSDKARAFVGALTALTTGTSYSASAELAKALEPFEHFELNRKPMLKVMGRHRKSLDDIAEEYVSEDLMSAAKSSWDSAINKGKRHGFRNAQATVIAPTGTISFLLGTSMSTSIEPSPGLVLYKNLAGGGTLQLVNNDVPKALHSLGYTPNQIEDINDFILKNGTVINSPHMDRKHYEIFDTAFGNESGQGSLPFEAHVKMLGAAQPFVSGGISKTCNLAETATVKDIYDSYVLGNQLGLKALAVFRNNSKPTSAYSFGNESFVRLDRGMKEELPSRRNGLQTEVKINGAPLHVLVGDYPDGRPGQITFLSFKAGSTLKALLEITGIDASKALQRGVHLEDVISGWAGQEFKPNGLVSGHPYIKTALSPLDFAQKLLLLEYMGKTDLAETEIDDETGKPKPVPLNDLWGAQNGSIRHYAREKIDDWNIDDVLKDPELGGFVQMNKKHKEILNLDNKQKLENKRGVTCQTCGNIMNQTAPNCFSCSNCGDKIGGCGI